MARYLKIHKTNKTKKYKLYSTVSDQDLTDWLTLEECRRYRMYEKEMQKRLEIIEEYLGFPNGFWTPRGEKVWEEAPGRKLEEFENKLSAELKLGMEAYYAYINGKYDEIMKEMDF